MEKELRKFPSNTCRTCLCESNELKPISAKIEGERSILDALNFVVNIDIPISNGLPNHVCCNCETILYKADAFKHRCLEAEMILFQELSSKNKDITGSFSQPVLANTTLKQSLEPSVGPNETLKEHYKEEYTSEVSPNRKLTDLDQHITIKSVKAETDEFDDYVDISYGCDDVKSNLLLESTTETSGEVNLFEKVVKKKKPAQKGGKKKTKANKKGLQKVDKKFQCDVCLKYFLRLSALKQHVMTHTADEKPQICPFCGKTFKQGLSQHMKRHMGKKPYKCEICDKSFVMPSELKKHRNRFHNKARPFVCAECGEGFSATSNLYSHQRRRHTGERRHACELCAKRFFESNDLTKHMLTHTGEKPYPCSHCGRAFARKHHLTTHMKQHRDKLAHTNVDET